MSEFNNNNDTFLSRVFGLHSVYNQLQDNYQYYDPEINSEYEPPEGINGETDDAGASQAARSEEGLHESNMNKKYVDSESDSDLSSSSSDSERVAGTSSFKSRQNTVNWDGKKSHYEEDDDEGSDPREDFLSSERDDLLTSLTAPQKSRKLKFNLPNTRKFFDNVHPGKRENNNTILPIYYDGAETSFRRPSTKFEPSAHTLYQKKNRKRMMIPPKERALYLWANITNMDEFLSDVYYYYRAKGILNIVLSRIVDLLILVFILSFTVFLKWGIDYDIFTSHFSKNTSHSITLKNLIKPNYLSKEVPFSAKFLLFGFFCYIVLRVIQLHLDFKYKLNEIRNFYKHLLGVEDDNELMTISWTTIVERMMLLKDYNSLTSTNNNIPPHYLNDLRSKVRLNAHDIANRIMRKENYFIALINKDVLDLSIPLPLPSPFESFFSTRSVLTRTLEWNLKLCINNFVFNQQGQVNSVILKESNRNQFAKELNSRFKMAAIINLILCPFIVIYFVLLYFFRYFNEYKSNPSSILGLRQYTPWAEWKLREFNELPHFFIKRLHLSVGPANTYINQFPRGFLVVNTVTLVNFISGAITAVLVIMGLWFEDEEHSFWSFELTENRSSLFYISLLGTIWAVTSSSLNASTSSNSSENLNPNSSSFFYDPEASLRYVSQFTHYLPRSWNGRLHSIDVKNEFCELFSLKIIIIVNEILSLVLTPFILWFKVSSNAGSIIDFFREYSIHVDGMGYVCYFAMFNFEEKDKNMMHSLNKRKRSKRSHRDGAGLRNGDREAHRSKAKKGKDKIHDTDSSDDDDFSDDNLLNDNYYQNEKMIKSYMYFLESYGGANANGKKPTQPPVEIMQPVTEGLSKARSTSRPEESKPRVRTPAQTVGHSQLDPSLSLMVPGANGSNNNTNQSMIDSLYNITYRFDESEEDFQKRGNRSGVLGMLNQFYKQDIGR